MSGILPLVPLLLSVAIAAPPSDSGSGSGGVLDASSVVDLNADLPAPLAEAIQLNRAQRYLSASVLLHDLLVSGDWPAHDSRIRYELGRSLQGLDLPHAADHFYRSVLRKGTDDPMFGYALLKTLQTAEALGDDTTLRRIAPRIADLSAVPDSARSTILYLQGLAAYEDADLQGALSALEAITLEQPRGPEAFYLRGVIYNEQGKLKSSVRAFRDLVRTEGVSVDPELQAKAILNIARVYYSIEHFEDARLYYQQVPRGSDAWVQAVYERSWAELMVGDTDGTLGDLLTVESPYFTAHRAFPEASLLRAIAYFNLCDDAGIQHSLATFARRSAPIHDELSALIADHRVDSGARAGDVWQHYFGGEAEVQTALPGAFFAEALRGGELREAAVHLQRLDAEQQRAASQRRDWRDSVGATLADLYVQDQAALEQRAGRMLLREAASTVAELDELSAQADIIRLEALTAQYQELQRRAEAAPPPLQVERGRSPEWTYVGTQWRLTEPFNGEFWEDELGYYRYQVPSACP